MNLVLGFEDEVDAERLRRAIRLTLDVEPILGCRFEERWYRPVWRRRDDLDAIELCEAEDDPDGEGLSRFLARPLDDRNTCQVLGRVFRGHRHTVGLKLSHRVGDGQALKQYAYLLADVYRALGEDPGHVPAPNPYRDRSLRQMVARVDEARQEELRQYHREHLEERTNLARWLPDRAVRGGPYAHIETISPERYARWFAYARERRATVLHVLLAALFRATREIVPVSGDRPLPICSAVDLRRYVRLAEPPPFCNLFGMINIALPQTGLDSLDETVLRVRDEVMAERKQLGLTSPPFSLETNRKTRLMIRCVPFRWAKRFLEGRLPKVITGLPLLTDVGGIDAKRLDFGGPRVVSAAAVSGQCLDGSLMLFCVSSFGDRLTIGVNAAGADPTRSVLSQLLQVLPD